MNNQKFNVLVEIPKYFPEKNSKGEVLKTKEDFINDMIEKQNATSLKRCLVKNINEVREDFRSDYIAIDSYCNAINGLENAIFLERCSALTMDITTPNFDLIDKYKQQKLDYINKFVKFLNK